MRISFGIAEDDGNGAVVGEIDFHVGLEDAGLGWYAVFLAQEVDKFVVEFFSEIGIGGVYETWAVSFSAICGEGELTYRENFAVFVDDGFVHFFATICKNTQIRAFFCHPLRTDF